MNFLAPILALASIITPSRQWTPPALPLTVTVKAETDSQLVLTDFEGKTIPSKAPAEFNGEKSYDLKQLWTETAVPGTYVLYIVPKGKSVEQFEGTPLLIEVRSEHRRGMPAEAEVTRVAPLEYAVMTTDQGPLTMVFYHDVAPITSASFLYLSRTGYYDKLTFHRIVKDFVIQGGDPKGDGTGGPGYNVQAEFNDRKHLEGVLSMARQGDANEAQGGMPGCEAANSAGSQFFVCLDYANTRHLDNKYTAFGRVVQGMDAVKKIAATPLADPQAGKPVNPPVIEKVEVKPVTAGDNPYAEMFHMKPQAGGAAAPK